MCGVAQLVALMIFPLFSKHFNRHQLYTGATALVIAGYALFFFAEHSLVLIAVSAVIIFIGQAFIQLLMLMFLRTRSNTASGSSDAARSPSPSPSSRWSIKSAARSRPA